ncbi:hypothetical protein EDC04DRAFT_2670256 [Pisolithus marmoratus]|nr:hypothetical protein EDC04DRAFT_2670256 [Pisolithus marmoratus]
MSGRGVSTGHVLPANPTYIDFPISDGDVDQWPTNTTRIVDSEGHVNYMRPVPLDESLCIKWRCEVGASLAVRLNKPVGPTYVLRGWPENYQMFDHNKGPAGGPRHDAYLMGSRYAKRFRSVPEFIPHALWLLTDPTLNRANCACKYCNRKPQREITLSMGLLPGRSTPLTGAHAARSQRVISASTSASASARQMRDRGKPYAAIRRAPRPVKRTTGPKYNMSRERNADLRTAYAEGIELRRWFRDGELLWCALNPPIPGLTGDKEAITFWPGLVEEAKIKSEAVATPKSSDDLAERNAEADVDMTDATQPDDGFKEAPAAESSNSSSNSTDNDEGKQVPWTVVQTLWYKIKLLGIPYTYNIRADQVLPYQAHAPSDELIQAIHRVPLEQMNTNTDSFKPSDTTQFAEAAAPFALAVQIAANLAGYWTPTDDWEYKFSIPPSPNVATPPIPTYKNDSTSLHAVMNASMAYNASLSESISAAGPSSGSTYTPPTLAHNQTVTQIRYQGLWWGAERIWTDELLRLKLSRGQVAPQGAENILPPAGPSPTAIEYARTLDDSSADCEDIMGAAGRGLFMLLEGLYVVDVPKVNGSTGKECRATGMLYELVDEDWEKDEGEGPGNGKGKGKATEHSSGAETPPNLANGVTAGSISIEAPTGSQLANPNPAVPVERTTSDVVSHTDSMTVSGQTKTPSPNELLSRPVLSSPFPLPPPPEGFKFRPILTPGYEAVISLNLIAGRYYPRLLQHPLLHACVEKALDVESGGLVEASQLWALEGLTPGFNNTMDPVRWRPTRVGMVREADKEARQGLEEHWRARAREKEEREAMEASYLPLQQLPDGVPVIEVLETNVSSMEVDSQGTRGD